MCFDLSGEVNATASYCSTSHDDTCVRDAPVMLHKCQRRCLRTCSKEKSVAVNWRVRGGGTSVAWYPLGVVLQGHEIRAGCGGETSPNSTITRTTTYRPARSLVVLMFTVWPKEGPMLCGGGGVRALLAAHVETQLLFYFPLLNRDKTNSLMVVRHKILLKYHS